MEFFFFQSPSGPCWSYGRELLTCGPSHNCIITSELFTLLSLGTVRCATGQTILYKKKSADSLYHLYKWHGPQTPLKMFQKIPPKFHDKTVQSNMLWLNLNRINGISFFIIFIFLQLAHKQGNPSFDFHAPGSKRRFQCTQTASAVPKYFPCLLQFCTVYRIWHTSRVWKRKTSEKRWFTRS